MLHVPRMMSDCAQTVRSERLPIQFRVYQVDINGIVVACSDRQGFDGLRALFCHSYQRQKKLER